MTTTYTDSLSLSQLVEHPNNPRRQCGDVEGLAQSIAEQGLLEPIIVAPLKKGTGKFPHYMLIAGHRRVCAAKQAGLTALPAVIRADLAGDERGQLEAMLVENLQRTDLTPAEEARAYQQLTLFDGTTTAAAIAQRVGRSETTVRGRLAIAALDGELLDRLDDGQMTLEQAGQLAEFADEPAVMAKLAENVGGGYQFQWAYDQAKHKREVAIRRAKSEKAITDSGVKVASKQQIERHYSLDLSALVDADTGSKLTPAGHATCKGHRAYIDVKGNIAHLCASPKRHGHLERYEYSRKRMDHAVAAGESEVDKVRAALEEAAGLRIEFLAGLVRGKPTADSLDFVIGWLDGGAGRPDWGQAAYLAGVTDADGDSEDGRTAILSADARTKLQALVAATAHMLEQYVRPRSWVNDPDQLYRPMLACRGYFDWLVHHGYTLTPAERTALGLQTGTAGDDNPPADAGGASQTALDRGVSNAAVADLMIRTGLTPDAVWLAPKVRTARGACPVCEHQSVPIQAGGAVGTHKPKGDGYDKPCAGIGERALGPDDVPATEPAGQVAP